MTIWVVCKAAGETEFSGPHKDGKAAVDYYELEDNKPPAGTLKLDANRLSRLRNGKSSKNENAAWEVREQDTKPASLVDVSGAVRQLRAATIDTAHAQTAASAQDPGAPEEKASEEPVSPPPAPLAGTVSEDEKCLIIEEPNTRRNWTLVELWSWLINLLALSRALVTVAEKTRKLKTVAQGTVLEVIVAECLKLIHKKHAKEVEHVSAKALGQIGDDGTDITVETIGDFSPNIIIDCKNYGKTKGTRPNVRSVIGALMTHKLTTGEGNEGGVGILLVTRGAKEGCCFTDGAIESRNRFNKLHRRKEDYEVKCWTFEDEFKSELVSYFEDIHDDEARDEFPGKLLRKILLGLEKEELISYV